MSSMFMRSVETTYVALGVYKGYDRAGLFIVVRDFDLDAFVGQAKVVLKEP
ncbi:hypothetical protein Q8O96_12635 [Pseudomonas sp. LPH60]|uniref:hypothetical protein n=1 Tax=Pseudomonas sp. LPH60 TaxID=3065906 RepID=UPI00273A7B7B|nr:hypothetical protein [Pseudomonas sp. LPH60]MDP4569894.1 hypothetical protein [Pseudomonas sp. LPH60]